MPQTRHDRDPAASHRQKGVVASASLACTSSMRAPHDMILPSLLPGQCVLRQCDFVLEPVALVGASARQRRRPHLVAEAPGRHLGRRGVIRRPAGDVHSTPGDIVLAILCFWLAAHKSVRHRSTRAAVLWSIEMHRHIKLPHCPPGTSNTGARGVSRGWGVISPRSPCHDAAAVCCRGT